MADKSGVVSLTCTEISTSDEHRNQQEPPRLLEDFRDVPAYVLLGNPGSGKTTAFGAEVHALGESAILVTARNFLALDLNSHPEWRDRTLFIDGLDEVRAGVQDARQPLDEIRRRLDALGKPHFRISCRAADWLGNNDRKHLDEVAQNSEVKTLGLNPLSDLQISQVLSGLLGSNQAQEFISTARDRGIYDLLANPQSLTMLTKVVGRNQGWPESRRETFEKTCLQLLSEQNEEHQLAAQAPRLDLMRAAGRLFSHQLISGAAGFSFDPDGNDPGYPSLNQCGSSEIFRSVLTTNVFTAESNSRFIPTHRQIAEFLGGRYLAEVVEAGLPVRRVISLIVGEDGLVVTEMRGLAAWFGAHASIARPQLIELDPIGVGLYGDICTFSLNDRRTLLKALRREGIRLSSLWRSASAFRTLAVPDMEPDLKEILIDTNRDPDHQMFTDFVLQIVAEGAVSSDLSGMLIKIVRDRTRWPRVHTAALDALIAAGDIGNKTHELKALLADIQSGGIIDSDNELLGTLLSKLYPDDLPPSEVWDHLSEEGNPELIGRHYVFWERELLEKSSDEQVAELIDNLQDRLSKLRPALQVRHLDALPLDLLAQGVESHGDALDKERLYNWLTVGSTSAWDRLPRRYGEDSFLRIRSWLESQPDIQKVVLLEGLNRIAGSSNFVRDAYRAYEQLYGSHLPSDFGIWCLGEAVASVERTPDVATYLMELACRAYTEKTDDDGLSLKILQQNAGKHDLLRISLSQSVSRSSTPPDQSVVHRGTEQYGEEQHTEEDPWLNHLRSNEVALRENRASPSLLYRIAKRYFGRAFRNDGPESIEKWLQGDQGLADAAIQGLRGVICRTDVPTIEEIIDRTRQDRVYHYALPFLAGLSELERTGQVDSSRWDENLARKALAFYYCAPHGDFVPDWYRRLLEYCPDLVAAIQLQFAVSEFRHNSPWIFNLWHLAHDPGHAKVARHGSLDLLRAFPIRCKPDQIGVLDNLLWAALQHANTAPFQKLIEAKLSRTTMNVFQRVHWLAVAVIVSSNKYRKQLYEFVKGSRRRTQHLAVFYSPEDPVQFSFDDVDNCLLKFLISLIGRHFGPHEEEASGWVASNVKSSNLARNLIQHLARVPTESASIALADLASDAALSSWRGMLSQVQHEQAVIRRDVGFNHPSIEQVARTLNNAGPANAADLAELLHDFLSEIADKVRTANTDDWRPFWNEDARGRPESPKHEDSCRDAILSQLCARLTSEVDAQPEGHYANDRRADIRVSCRDFQVPIEIKKNSNRNLWTACKDQLIGKYTIDPATHGYGIYLILWFGKACTHKPRSEERPDNPQELTNRLRATLSDRESRKIYVLVVDLSRDPR